jgi:hypothetical protein
MARSSQDGNTHKPIGAVAPSNSPTAVDLSAQPGPGTPHQSSQSTAAETSGPTAASDAMATGPLSEKAAVDRGNGTGERIARTASARQDGETTAATDMHSVPVEAPKPDYVPLAPETQAVGFRCHIDQVADNQIEGWIARPDRAGHRSIVALREGDRILARAIASRFRADLVTAGLGDGCHAFVLPMPRRPCWTEKSTYCRSSSRKPALY